MLEHYPRVLIGLILQIKQLAPLDAKKENKIFILKIKENS